MTHPQRWPVARENEKFSFELRELLYGIGSRPTYRALYVVNADELVILTIRHVSQQDVSPGDF